MMPFETLYKVQRHTVALRCIKYHTQDTIVKDPFYTHMPAHFNMSFKELLAAKHPHAWVEFEKGFASEQDLLDKFFSDGRPVDGDALKAMLVSKYEFIPGMRELLKEVQSANHEMHVISNYPVWYELIEEKLRLSDFLPWTFVSCTGPMKGHRKPDKGAYDAVITHLAARPEDLVLVDDRAANVDAAIANGMRGIVFSGAEDCRLQLADVGVTLQ